jgi:hypothetical protein
MDQENSQTLPDHQEDTLPDKSHYFRHCRMMDQVNSQTLPDHLEDSL